MIADFINPHGKPTKQFNSIEFLLEQVIKGTYEYGEDKILQTTLPKAISITRPSERTIGTPFVSTFHKVDMYFDLLTWKVDDPIINIKMTSTGDEVKMVLESNGYFRAERYQRIQGIADLNPLYLIKQYAQSKQLSEISVGEYAAHGRMSDTQIRSLFMTLSSQGFLSYNSTTDIAIIKEKPSIS